MTYIIAEPCVGTCDTACVEVCPVDCIHGPHDKTGAGAEAKADGFVQRKMILYILIPKSVLIVVPVNLSAQLKQFSKKVKSQKSGISI